MEQVRNHDLDGLASNSREITFNSKNGKLNSHVFHLNLLMCSFLYCCQISNICWDSKTVQNRYTHLYLGFQITTPSVGGCDTNLAFPSLSWIHSKWVILRSLTLIVGGYLKWNKKPPGYTMFLLSPMVGVIMFILPLTRIAIDNAQNDKPCIMSFEHSNWIRSLVSWCWRIQRLKDRKY